MMMLWGSFPGVFLVGMFLILWRSHLEDENYPCNIPMIRFLFWGGCNQDVYYVTLYLLAGLMRNHVTCNLDFWLVGLWAVPLVLFVNEVWAWDERNFSSCRMFQQLSFWQQAVQTSAHSGSSGTVWQAHLLLSETPVHQDLASTESMRCHQLQHWSSPMTWWSNCSRAWLSLSAR